MWLDLPALGFAPGDRLIAHDEVTGETYDWGDVQLRTPRPARAVAHVVTLTRRTSEDADDLT